MSESCPVCGFVWDDVTADAVGPRLSTAAAGFGEVLLGTPEEVLRAQPDPDVWTPLEYAGHVRDVLFNLRDRVVLGFNEDNPVTKSMYGGVRIARGMQADDPPDEVAVTIAAGARLLARTVAVLTPEELQRTAVYGWPREAARPLLWIAAQALHEAEHHLTDVRTLVSG